jgi:primase-polymerase (primpol)-like protein
MMRVPPELLGYKQWVIWRKLAVNGRVTKVPISPWSGKAAACDRPQTWSTFWHVRHAVRKYGCDGIGFVFTQSDPFCGIDLDRCRDANGIIAPEALELIRRFDSFTELSPSGNGAHILISAKLAGRGRRSGKIEMYDSGRYFTITGKHLSGTPRSIHNRQQILDDLTADVFGPEPKQKVPRPFNCDPDVSDDDLILRAHNSRNGDHFGRLWQGDTSDYSNDHSRADLALCRMLSFWCRGDADRIDRLFRRSGLMRDKWDLRAGQIPYGSRTIKAVLPEA